MVTKKETGNGVLTGENRLAHLDGQTEPVQKGKAKDAISIQPLKQAIITIPIIGTTPLKVLRFSQKAKRKVMDTHEAGDQAKTKRSREPKNFNQNYEEAKYVCTQGDGKKRETWCGLNASGVRNGCIETCRVAGYVMTRAKMSVFCEHDGLDDFDATPLVRIIGTPEMSVDTVRNANGVIDLRARAMWKEWRMVLRIRFDETQFSPSDVINLVIRVGQQNGLGEGRPNGTEGNGTGNGLFLVDVGGITLERLSPVPLTWTELGDGK